MPTEEDPSQPDPSQQEPPDQTGKGSKEQVLADLASERRARQASERDRKALTEKLQQIEDAGKSDLEKLAERLTVAERRAVEAETREMRLDVAASKGLTPAQARRLVGATREELEADADELVATFRQPDPAGTAGRLSPLRPSAALGAGGDPTTQEPTTRELREALAKMPRF